jgi:hypothetical protein
LYCPGPEEKSMKGKKTKKSGVVSFAYWFLNPAKLVSYDSARNIK